MENKLVWKSEKECQDELNKRIKSWKKGQSRDGLIVRAKGKFIYKGIAYLIKVLRYFDHTNKFTPMGSQRITDSHAVVEYPDETKPIADLIPTEFMSEFLYHDTLHSFNDKQTIEQQIEVCHKLAKEDINNFLSGKVNEKIDKKIRELQKLKEALNKKVLEVK